MLPTQTPGARSWNERKRLIRFRRRTEHLRFSEEIKLIPKSLVYLMLALLVLGEGIALRLCALNIPEMWEPVVEFGPNTGLAAVAGIGLAIWMVIAAIVFLVGYVNVDAKRRGMNATMWTFIVVITLPAYLAVGFILYFIA